MTGYYTRIMTILEPKIGKSLAQSVLRTKCEKLGIVPENITQDALPALVDELYEPLRIFGGDVFAQSLTTQIRAIAG